MMRKKRLYLPVTLFPLICIALIAIYISVMAIGTDNGHDAGYKDIFSDIKENDWFSSDVRYVYEKGLMNGTDENAFSPNETMTRGMVVTVLWRLEGQPQGNDVTFNDVKSGSYYYNAVAWAAENKIVNGYDEKTFAPGDNITREQLAAIFYRYADHKGYDISKKADLSKFSDSGTIGDYAVNAIEWAAANGIITGTSENTISPKGNALRCQVAAILKRFCETFVSGKKDIENIENAKKDNKISSGNSSGGNMSGTDDDHMVDDPDITVDDMNIPYITIEEVSAALGDEVKIIAEINKNPGILGMTLTVNYDMNNLVLEKAENGDAFNNVLDMTTSKTLFSGAKFVWDGLEIKPQDIRDGTFLTMTFKIPETAKAGKYPITLNYMPGDIVDNNLDSIDLPIETGCITINN